MTAQETNVVNAVASTLGSTMAAGATSFTVASASGFPSVPFYVVIDPDDPAKREYMLVDSSLAGTTASMSNVNKRNLSGSAGDVEHASGAVVRVSPPMKQLFDDIHDRVDGAVLEADTSTSGFAFVVDEDNMTSNSATKVPTQQSVKAYVDAQAGGLTVVGYGQTATSQTGVGTSFTDLTSLTTGSVTPSGTIVWVEGWVTLEKKTAAGFVQLELVEDSTAFAELNAAALSADCAAVDDLETISFCVRHTTTAAAHTFKVQARAENNTVDVHGGLIRVLE